MQFIELVSSSAAGAALQASKSYQNPRSALIVFLTGWTLAFLTANDVKIYIEEQFGIALGVSAVAFLMAYLGTPILTRADALIDAVKIKGQDS